MNKFETAGLISTALLGLLSVFTVLTSPSGLKVTVIGLTAFLAMILGTVLNLRGLENTKSVIWAYGLSGGAALASILYFIVPKSMGLSTEFGVTGVLAGFLFGLVLHVITHEIEHEAGEALSDLISVTVHAVAAGSIIGQIYSDMPTISIILGISIVSHKLPAGYIISDKLNRSLKETFMFMALPASILGTLALTVFNLSISMPVNYQALFLGFSAGIFLHVALDFIPEPEPESHLRKLLSEEEDPLHHKLDEIKFHCVASTVMGAGIVAILALLL